MPIVETDLDKFYLSGGVANGNIAASLGGEISSSIITSDVVHNLFELVSSNEALNGMVDYRCIYIRNNHPTITLTTPKIWIDTPIPGSDVSIDIGIGPSPINGIEQAILNENTLPSGVIFSNPTIKIAGIGIPDLQPLAFKALWLRRTVNANANPTNSTNFILGFGGDTIV